MASTSGSARSSSYEPYALGIARAVAASCAFERLRDAMATILVYSPCCIAGRTFLRPILAVLRTPQRSFLFMTAMITPGAETVPQGLKPWPHSNADYVRAQARTLHCNARFRRLSIFISKIYPNIEVKS